MSKANNNIGFLFLRKNLYKLSMNQLKQELTNHLFEMQIIHEGIKSFLSNKFKQLDSSIGDWKCQTRSSMILDLNKEEVKKKIKTYLPKIQTSIKNLEQFQKEIESYNSIECQTFTRQQLNKYSLFDIFFNFNLSCKPDEVSIFLGLNYLTTINNQQSHVFQNQKITINKFKDMINKAKSAICHFSIDYENQLAKQYCMPLNQTLLHQTEFKGMQHMTSLFAGFIPILQKMKKNNQPFFISFKIFCKNCSGIQEFNHELWTPIKNKFQQQPMPKSQNSAIAVIDAYQYPGSLSELQQHLKIPSTATDIPTNFLKTCTCKTASKKRSIHDFDQAIMAFFAQHPQFTNGAEIDWKGLGLENSDLKKEYDFLRTLKGFSRLDMSVFHINHMYTSTIQDVLKHDTEIIKKLEEEKAKLKNQS